MEAQQLTALVFTGTDSDSAIATSGEWRLRQLFEQFAADPIEPIFFHDVEL